MNLMANPFANAHIDALILMGACLFLPLVAARVCFAEFRDVLQGTACNETQFLIGLIALLTIGFELLGVSFVTGMI